MKTRNILANYQPRHPECLLLDLKIPEMDGVELLRRLRADGHMIPVIIFTAYGDSQTIVEVMKLGAFDFLQKGCRLETVIDAVNRALATSTPLAVSATDRSQPDCCEVPRNTELVDPLPLEIGKSLLGIVGAFAHDMTNSV
ncbi:MAG TPA: response regulator, partial [Planctomycetaceae bacterium]